MKGDAMIRNILLVLGLLIVSTASPALADHQSRTVRVDCANGETLSAALADRIDDEKPLVIEFTGTCTESVIIDRDDVTIRGGSSTATLVGRIVVEESRMRPVFSDFTIRDTPPDPNPNGRLGDAIIFNASLGGVAENLRIINPGGNGILVDDGSQVRMRDVTVTDCGVFGVATGASSGLIVTGKLVTNGCQVAGVQIGFGSQMTLHFDSIIEANDNLSAGLLVQLFGQATFFSGSRLITQRNGAGIQVVNKGSVTYGDCRMDISNNQTFGILVGELSDWTPFGGALPTINVSGNGGAGIGVIRRSFLRLREGTVISSNAGPGLLVDASDIAVRDTSIQNNGGPSALVLFDSTATFDGGNTFNTPIVCDGTVISRGQFVCPTTSSSLTTEQRSQYDRWRTDAEAVLP
jgi:hypothetical protein